MSGFDTFLDWTIPKVIFIVGMFLFYKALKEPLDKLGGIIKRGINYISGSPETEDYTTIEYE